VTNDGRYLALQNALLKARNDANLTQLEVATRLSRPQSFVSKYENGERRLDLVELFDVCEVLDIEVEAIVAFIRGDNEATEKSRE